MSKILQGLAAISRPVSPPKAWKFLPVVGSLRRLGMGGTQLMQILRQDFSETELESAGVLVGGSGGGRSLSPVLAGDAPGGLFLRVSKDAAPFDLVNQHGALIADDPPAFHACSDYFTRQWSGSWKGILVAFTDDDLAVLRMLSLPCTPAAGLSQMYGPQVRRLCRDPFEVDREASARVPLAPLASCDYRLVLVGWSPAQLSQDSPYSLGAVVRRLTKVAEAYGADIGMNVTVWQPAAAHFNRIASAVEIGDQVAVRRRMWESVQDSTTSMSAFAKVQSPRADSDYILARRELLRTLHRAREVGHGSAEIANRLENFNGCFGNGVVDAIISDAMSASDPLERSLLLGAAELMEALHGASGVVVTTRESIARRPRRHEETSQCDDLQTQLRVVDGLVKIHRELYRSR